MQKMEDRLFNNKHLDAQIHSFLFTFIFKITRSYQLIRITYSLYPYFYRTDIFNYR